MDEQSLLRLLLSHGYTLDEIKALTPTEIYLEIAVEPWRLTTEGVRGVRVAEWSGGPPPVKSMTISAILCELRNWQVLRETEMDAPQTEREKELLDELYWRESSPKEGGRALKWENNERWPQRGRDIRP
jgi:hypothetical protein